MHMPIWMNEEIFNPLSGNCKVNEISSWLFIPSTFCDEFVWTIVEVVVNVLYKCSYMCSHTFHILV
jgi:hypothetical protein